MLALQSCTSHCLSSQLSSFWERRPQLHGQALPSVGVRDLAHYLPTEGRARPIRANLQANVSRRDALLWGSATALPMTQGSSAPAVMASEAPQGVQLYPLHHCKTIYFVRHGQGYHNVAGEKNYAAYMSYDYFDASLTPKGWSQAAALKKHIAGGPPLGIELVVTSPMLRTMQTAVGVFGGSPVDGVVQNGPLLMAAANGSGPVSGTGCPPFLAVELCREQLGEHPCDKRRCISEYKPLFPGIDLSLVETDADTWYQESTRESKDELGKRGQAFINWLLARKEQKIAVVSHSGFLRAVMELAAQDHEGYQNCEMRALVLVDPSGKSAVGKVDYPGGFPAGASAGSELLDEVKEKA